MRWHVLVYRAGEDPAGDVALSLTELRDGPDGGAGTVIERGTLLLPQPVAVGLATAADLFLSSMIGVPVQWGGLPLERIQVPDRMQQTIGRIIKWVMRTAGLGK